VAQFLINRAGVWYFARRVPLEFEALDRRGVVKQSTGVKVADDPMGVRGAKVVDAINRESEAYWLALAEGQAVDARRRYDAARARARRMGFEYVPAADLAQAPLQDILARLEALASRRLLDDPAAVSAALGGLPRVEIPLGGLFDAFRDIAKAELMDLSPDQLRKWANPKKRAIANLISVVGDKDAAALTRADALDLWKWWQDRVIAGDVDAATASKDFSHLKRMVRTVVRHYRLPSELLEVFSDLQIGGAKDGTRAAYEPAFVQGRMLAPGALDRLNQEARRLVYLIAETGLRPSEAANLNESTIVLDHQVPHVKVRPDGRRMKTDESLRDIPLVGVALDALRAQPAGFPRYRDKSASLSGLVNRFLMNNGLRPTENHTLYSLRHTFKDRLRAVEAPPEMIDGLMGHAFEKPKYGAGYELAHKREWLQRIAFIVDLRTWLP
jgi:integrase